MPDPSALATFLFTDIEGSTKLWELEAQRMPSALALHDAITRSAVERHSGLVVKMTGDGVHAAFDDPRDALDAAFELQRALSRPDATGGIELKVRCGLHAGVFERRDNDFFGVAVNRAARIMNAAHGGQILLSEAVGVLVRERLPAGAALRDLGSVRLRDLAQPEHVYQLAHPALRVDFPALRSLEGTPNNLAQQLTSFVGREREVTQIRKLLGETRLLTLVGAGGIGKTRLSLQVAAYVMDDYPDGVWFIELAPTADARLVPQSVASLLGVKEETGRPVIEALVKYVADKKILLILDNCEHLVAACSDLVRQLLQAGAAVKIIASSREHLHVTGETSYAVPALAAPDPREPITLHALAQFEAVRLFTERAAAVRPGFSLTAANAPAVSSICHRLDGIPLALELAAARVRTLSIEQIAARLDDRFNLLTRGDQTTLPRQQTLRALIDWSYELLAPAERALFRRLAVFAGGWTLEAAESVATSEDLPRSAVLELLSNLVEKSLVAQDIEGERYQLLETVRQYAHERLDDSTETAAVQLRHLLFYVALTEKTRPELDGPGQGESLSLLDLERENILVANMWCDSAPDGGDLGLRLVSATQPYWINRGVLGLGRRLTSEALTRDAAQARTFTRCHALFNAGQLVCFMGFYREAQDYLEESLAIAREINDINRAARALQPLGMAHLGQGNLTEARLHYQEALALAEQLGDKRQLAAALNALAQLHRVEGKLDAAEPLYEQVVALAREVGDRESIAIGLLNWAMASMERGDDSRTPAMLLEVIAIAQEIGSKPAGQSALEVSAGLAARREQWKRSAILFGAAEARTSETGLHRDAADEAFIAPLIALTQQALGPSRYTAAEHAGRATSYAAAMDDARAWLTTQG